MTKADIADMAEIVAQAIYGTTGADEAWADLTDEERADFLVCAYAAMGAHDAFLAVKGYAVVMAQQGSRRPKLVAPAKRLLGADGRPVN